MEKGEKGAALTAALLQQAHGKVDEALLECLPTNDRKAIAICLSISSTPSNFLARRNQTITAIDTSWFALLLKQWPQSLHPVVLGCLPKKKAKELTKQEGLSIKPSQLAPIAKAYFTSLIFSPMLSGYSPPVEVLSQGKFAILLKAGKKALVKIVEFLAMNDVAQEMKKVVDKEVWQKLSTIIQGAKEDFFRLCMQRKSKLSLEPLNLKKWQGDNDALVEQLLERGFQRLGIALSQEHPSFLWKISRTLDQATGEKLLNYSSHAKSYAKKPGLIDTAGKDLLFVVNWMEQGG
ncbi:hypothetical protein JYU14_00525 [Simkania negevensis]|uniref:Uncharacterized protein n=1 Tax=Simkania negevensis TaxID=83561 RepID=A0ABS3AQF5_9BACT|nr:hypothetical protein [Simkania negevensis]